MKPKKRTTVDDDPLAEDRSADIAAMKFRRLDVHFLPKDATMTLRLPANVILGAKKVAKRRHVRYQTLLREAIVEFVAREGGF